jgi:putative protein kinase ArgK-like GTPase of G3E family
VSTRDTFEIELGHTIHTHYAMGSKGVSFLNHSALDALQFVSSSSTTASPRSREQEVSALVARMRKLEHTLEETIAQYTECEQLFDRIGNDRQMSSTKASELLKTTSDRVGLIDADITCTLNKVRRAHWYHATR